MAKKKRSKRTVVGSPLTPGLLRELGAIREFVFASEDFKPGGNWVNTYRIWTCHGYRESGNYNVGFVRIERAAGGSKEIFALKVHQEVVEVDGLLNVVEAEIKCVTSRLGCPVEWCVLSRFIDADGKVVSELGTKEEVEVRKNVMTVRIGERTFERQVPGQFTSDWCLFEAVQRLKFDKESSLNFDMLEGLSLLKQSQQLSYRGAYQMKLRGKNVSLHRFDQLGEGILPYEYWLDDSHRLLAAISMHKAYILDEQAEKAIRQRTEQLRKSYQRVKSTRRKKS